MRPAEAGGRGATIRDVARRAGVSTATVSRALRGGAGVGPLTRQRVEDAAQALRYRPSGVARSLKLRATRTIGLIVTDIENPYFPLIVRAVEDAARAHGYSVVLADGRRDSEREIQSLEILAERQVDGLLLASSALTQRHRSWIEDRPCPVVIINSGSRVASVPAVLSDNEAGGRMAGEHVLALGHTRVAYIATPAAHNVAVEERLRGVRAALRARGRPADELPVVLGDGSVEAGARAAREALERWPGTTALICYNDLTAVGALRGVRSMGLRVPQDVSVVGFDDIELAPYVDPPLTTVKQITERMGRWAVDTLVEAIEGRPAHVGADRQVAREAEWRIPVELVVRGSTGPAPADPLPEPARDRPERARRLPVTSTAGYVDRIGVRPGESVRLHVSAPAAHRLDIVRLGRTAILEPGASIDADRAEAEVLASFEHRTATPAAIEPGSYLWVDGPPLPEGPVSVGLWLRLWSLPVVDEVQWAWSSLLSDLDYPEAGRFALLIDHLGRLGVYAGDGGTFDHERLHTSEPLMAARLGRWCHVAASIGDGGVVAWLDGSLVLERRDAEIDGIPPPAAGSRLRLGACAERGLADDFLDGDIAAPFVAGTVLTAGQVARIVSDRARSPLTRMGLEPIHAAWPLDEESGDRARDISGHERHARILQGGTWQIGGPAFDASRGGVAYEPASDPDRGHGLRLSSDDLLDCEWPVTAQWQVPPDAPSGLYAATVRLEGQHETDACVITFAVTRRRPRAERGVALLLATNTWYAYGRRPPALQPGFGLSASFYSNHHDGRPHFWVTTLAPIPRATPFGFESARAAHVGHSHLVRPERYAEAWLEREGYAYEVITDLDLHEEPELLRHFDALLVAGHAEYWTDRARDGVEAFLDDGGAILALSGNSLHWRVTVDPSATLLECRKTVEEADLRWLGPEVWGERWHAQDGRPGGSSRLVGRPAHEILGLDSQGMIDDGTPTGFRALRVVAPEHPLFHEPEEVPLGPDGTLGGRSLNGPRVSGYEFDAIPEVVGSAPGRLPGLTLLATAEPQPNLEWFGPDRHRGADLVDWQRPRGGRVITLGSIGATGALAVDAGVAAFARNALAALGVQRRARQRASAA